MLRHRALRQLNSRLLVRNGSLSRYNRRFFSKEAEAGGEAAAKTEAAAKPEAGAGAGGAAKTPTPPPPPPSGGGGGMWIVLTAAIAGGAYYFKDEISEFVGMGSKEAKDVPATAVPNVPETKKEIKEVEQRLAAVPAPKPKAEVKAPSKTEAPKAAASSEEVDWKALRESIAEMLDKEGYDDGSLGPVFVRLAWHSAGTYDKNTTKGGSEGAAMRFSPEAEWGANAGLDVARAELEPIKAKFPGVTYSDLWSFAGTVAIEEMGGPEMKWRPGRKDHAEGANVLPDGLLPDADGREFTDSPQTHLRKIFNRMGFNDQEIVCLSGAHALGRCHTDRSGFWGPWTRAPTTFSNEYFRLLVEEKWSKKKTHEGKKWTGPEQYEDDTGDLMMLPTDMSLVWDEKFKKYVEIYAKDEEKFFADFAKAWIKLQELGVKKFHGWRRYIFFGPRE